MTVTSYNLTLLEVLPYNFYLTCRTHAYLNYCTIDRRVSCVSQHWHEVRSKLTLWLTDLNISFKAFSRFACNSVRRGPNKINRLAVGWELLFRPTCSMLNSLQGLDSFTGGPYGLFNSLREITRIHRHTSCFRGSRIEIGVLLSLYSRNYQHPQSSAQASASLTCWYLEDIDNYLVCASRCLLPPSSGFIALMMEAVNTSETSANFDQTTWRNIPEDSHLHTRRRENLQSHRVRISPSAYHSSATLHILVKIRARSGMRIEYRNFVPQFFSGLEG
jgi:hypothetical protein